MDKNQNLYIEKKNILGKLPFLELCLDNSNSNLMGNLASLVLAYPELNEEENLEGILNNLPEFTKNLFIILLKLFNNSKCNGGREDVVALCVKINNLILSSDIDFIGIINDSSDFIEIIKNKNYSKEEYQMIIQKSEKIEQKLKSLLENSLEFDDEIIKEYFKEWDEKYSKFHSFLYEYYSTKIGKEKEAQFKEKINELKRRVSVRFEQATIDFEKNILMDIKENLNNITKFEEENYLIAEDVNKAFRDCNVYKESSPKVDLIDFTIIEYNKDLKPKSDFQKIY